MAPEGRGLRPEPPQEGGPGGIPRQGPRMGGEDGARGELDQGTDHRLQGDHTSQEMDAAGYPRHQEGDRGMRVRGAGGGPDRDVGRPVPGAAGGAEEDPAGVLPRRAYEAVGLRLGRARDNF